MPEVQAAVRLERIVRLMGASLLMLSPDPADHELARRVFAADLLGQIHKLPLRAAARPLFRRQLPWPQRLVEPRQRWQVVSNDAGDVWVGTALDSTVDRVQWQELRPGLEVGRWPGFPELRFEVTVDVDGVELRVLRHGLPMRNCARCGGDLRCDFLADPADGDRHAVCSVCGLECWRWEPLPWEPEGARFDGSDAPVEPRPQRAWETP